MPVPWVQIVQFMPSILELSRELLKRSRRVEPPAAPVVTAGGSATAALESRIAALEENERRQAELVTNIAEQLAQLTVAVTALHRHSRQLLFGQLTAISIAVIALLIALR
jgi:uncharacterized coiled-coil protein SlyX